MSFRNLFKNKKKNKGKSANDFFASTSKPLLSNQLSLSKPTQTNVIETDYDKNSPSVDTPLTPMIHFNDSMPDTKPCDGTPSVIIEHGYEFVQLIRNTPQGQIYEACSTKRESERFAIKKVDKELFQQKRTRNSTISTSKNILKYALLLNHCTITNKAPGHHIAQFIDFFNDEQYYYLVMEYCGSITLQQWSQKAFEYIQNNRLDIKQYRKMVKFIFWQLTVLTYWLHNDMNICHLNITMDNIMIQNGNFIEGEDGMINISRKLNVKLIDFEMSEIFKTGNYIGKSTKLDFNCSKKDALCEYSVANVLNTDIWDARKADIWALGLLLYKLTFNEYPIDIDCSTVKDTGLWSIKADRLDTYIHVNRLSKYCTEALTTLLCGLLHYDERKRFDALNVLQCQWMAIYWQRYRIRITKKSFAQKAQLKSEWQMQMMKHFPYYNK